VDKNHRRRSILTDTAKKWFADARVVATDAMNRNGWTVPQQEKVIVEYTVVWADHRRRDPSNLEKVMLDALQCVTGDDQYVLPRCIDFSYDKGNPRVEVVVRRA
jgi:Holliday junction resolvase RusA-like endonuclease